MVLNKEMVNGDKDGISKEIIICKVLDLKGNCASKVANRK